MFPGPGMNVGPGGMNPALMAQMAMAGGMPPMGASMNSMGMPGPAGMSSMGMGAPGGASHGMGPGMGGGHGSGNAPFEKGGIFYKTRICTDWSEGKCRFGERCKYAHGEQELRALPPEGQEILERKAARDGQDGGHGGGDGGGGPPSTNKPPGRDEAWRKTRMCKDFQTGHCSFGERCFYAHGQHELRPPPGPDRTKQEAQAHAQAQMGPMGQMGPGMGLMAPGMGMGHMGMPGMGPMGHMQPAMMGQQPMIGGMMGHGTQQGMLQQSQQQHGESARGQAGHGRGRGGDGGGGSALLRPPPQSRALTQPPVLTPSKESIPLSAAATDSVKPAGSSSLQDPAARAEARYIERVRTTCGILNIGSAASLTKDRPDLVAMALQAVRTRAAYRANAFADDVSSYLPAPVKHAAPVKAATVVQAPVGA